jgi:hypothetical protein
MKLAPQGRRHHAQFGASDSHRGFTLRATAFAYIPGRGIQTTDFLFRKSIPGTGFNLI